MHVSLGKFQWQIITSIVDGVCTWRMMVVPQHTAEEPGVGAKLVLQARGLAHVLCIRVADLITLKNSLPSSRSAGH